MKDFDNILKYQELDIKLRRAQDSIEKSKVYENMEKARQDFSSAKKTRDDSEKTAENIISYIESAQKLYQEIDALVERVSARGEVSAEDAAQLEKAKNRLAEIESKLSDRKNHSEKIIKEFLDATDKGKKVKSVFDKNKEEFNKLKEQKQPEIDEIVKQMKALEGKIDKDILTKYKEITAEGIFPALMEVYIDEKGVCYCHGCGLALSQSKTSELKTNSYCVHACKRIVYKKQ